MIITKQTRSRCVEKDGQLYVGVTSAMKLVRQLLGEPEESYGPPALMKIHCAEGTGCHATCLNWLAFTNGLIPSFTPVPWNPMEHPDEHRWNNVMFNALVGFTEFCDQYKVTPIGIEQEAFSKAYGLVGHVDLFCELTWKGKRKKAVIDLKFVTTLMESHRLQLRCYSKLSGINDAQIGLLYHADRYLGIWRIELVDLTTGLDDVAAVANAARLYAWAEQKGR